MLITKQFLVICAYPQNTTEEPGRILYQKKRRHSSNDCAKGQLASIFFSQLYKNTGIILNDSNEVYNSWNECLFWEQLLICILKVGFELLLILWFLLLKSYELCATRPAQRDQAYLCMWVDLWGREEGDGGERRRGGEGRGKGTDEDRNVKPSSS